MKPCKKSILILLCFGFHGITYSQGVPFYCQSNVVKVVDASNKVLQNPFAGGLMFPYFGSLDLNMDGKMDIVLLDKADQRIMTFINQSDSGKIKYLYFPFYEKYLPDTLSKFMNFVDYDGDGKSDIWAYATYDPSGIEVYKNTTLGNNISFLKVTNQIKSTYYCNDSQIFNLYLTSDDEPVIVDIDGDGDFDVLVSSQAGGAWVNLYKNNSVELYHVKDSLTFDKVDDYWGYFMESATSNLFSLHRIDSAFNCKNYPCLLYRKLPGTNLTNHSSKPKPPKRHTGSSAFILDLDDDGDLDMLVGDVSYPNIKMLVNGRKQFHSCYDSMISQYPFYPISHPVKIRAMPGIFYQDVDNDGVKDLLFSPMGKEPTDTFQNLHHVWYYKNTGTNTKVTPQFKQDDFLIDQMIQTGGPSSPAFFDYDSDGDEDLFIMTRGNYIQTFYYHDHIFLYKNLGKKDSNVFKLMDTNYLNLYSAGIVSGSLAFGDIDMDGSKDLLIGNKSGKFTYYHNDAAPGQPANFSLITQNFEGITIPGRNGDGYSTVAIADISGDSLNDLVAGGYYGRLYYYKNTGTKLNPAFTLITDTFMNIFYLKGYYMAPAIADLNGDGKLDMVLTYDHYSWKSGIEAGKVDIYYHINDNSSAHFIARDTMIRYMVDGKPSAINTKSTGKNLKPAIIDLDGDHKPDIVLGSARGGLMFFGTNTSLFTQITTDRPTVLCQGDTVTLDAGFGFDSYTWSNGGTSQKIKIHTSGSYSCVVSRGGLTYTASITITDHPAVLTAEYTFMKNNLTYSFTPVNTDIDSIYWTFGDGTHSNQLNPVHTYFAVDSYRVCMFIKDHCAATAISCKLFNLLNINKKQILPTIKVFPNPASGKINILLSNVPLSGEYNLRLVDIMGKTVKTTTLIPDKLLSIDIHDLPAGLYQLLIFNRGTILLGKKVMVE